MRFKALLIELLLRFFFVIVINEFAIVETYLSVTMLL